jgi:hypothetical protein
VDSMAFATANSSNVPLWQAIVLGLAAGLGGGLLGTWTRISYERTAELRTRMIEAADEFATALSKTLPVLRKARDTVDNADYVISPAGDLNPAVQEAIDEIDQVWDSLHERFARVQLLFGIALESGASTYGWAALVSLRNAHNALRMTPHQMSDLEARGRMQYDQNLLGLYGDLDRFSQAARLEIRAGFWRSAWRWFKNTPPARRVRIWNALVRRRVRRRREKRQRAGA